MKRTLIFAVVFSMFIATASYAYEVMEVKNGGSIKGKVKAAAKVEDPTIEIKKDTDYCGKSQKALMYILSPSLEVKNVIVTVEDVQKGKAAPKTDFTIDNTKCRFEPLVGIAYKDANLIIKNSDPILHNTNLALVLKDKRRTVYNLALPKKDQEIKKPVKVTGFNDVKCNAHSWMRGYVYISEHPYVAVTDENGNFEIKDLPPGKYKIRFWHEGFGETTKDVEISAGKVSELNATLTKK